MATFEKAFSIQDKRDIEIIDFIDKKHKGYIYCPECLIAPLHIVRKQKVTYFASNRKEEHSKDCQHYQDFIPNRNLTKLINSTNIEDKKRLEFLVTNNLQNAINLLLKKENSNSIKKTFASTKNSIKKAKNTTNTYKRENIPRVSIKNLYKKKDSLLNNYIIIWGKAEVESKSINTNFKTLIFRIDGKFRFSIPLTKNQIKYYKELPNNPQNTGFAVLVYYKKTRTLLI